MRKKLHNQNSFSYYTYGFLVYFSLEETAFNITNIMVKFYTYFVVTIKSQMGILELSW